MGKMIFLAVLSSASITLATTTLNGVSGGIYAPPAANDTYHNVYGGIQLGRDASYFSCTTGGTCDTCKGGTLQSAGTTPPSYYPCNQSGVFLDTVLTFNSTTTVTGAGVRYLLCDGTNPKFTAANLLPSLLSLTWAELCTALGNGGCSGNTSGTLIFGPAADCTALNSSAEKINIRINARSVDLTTASTYTYPGCAEPGACGFTLYPGDAKAYIDSIENFNSSSGSSGVPYNGVVFFSAVADPNPANDQASFEAVMSGSFSLTAFDTESDGTGINGSFISDGIENDSRYCFKMGTRDAAGNIEHISSMDCAGPDCTACVTPSEVIGILSDKKCFIATAAFGSDMDEHVQRIREFRNRFMAPHWIGRKLVKTYYSISPTLANWISKNETARTGARIMLYPILTWTELSLKYGWIVVLAPFLLVGALALLIVRRRQFS